MAIPARRVRLAMVALLFASLGRVLGAEPSEVTPADERRTEAARLLIRSMDIGVAAPAAVLAITTDLKKRLVPDYLERGAALDEAVKHTIGKLASRQEELETQLVPIYAQSLTTEDMDALADFYGSNLGKRFLAAQPLILKGSAAVTSAWAMRIRSEAEADIRAEMQANAKK